MNRQVFFSAILTIGFSALSCIALSQQIVSYKENGKWGFKKNDAVLIIPQYDTTFGFDAKQKIALVGNLNAKKNFINPLTKEVKKVFDYFYITADNSRISLVTADTKTVTEFVNQQRLQKEYLLNSNFFKIMYDSKIYLFDKTGKQITKAGFDNVAFTKCPVFFIVETKDKSGQIFVGLINDSAKTVVPQTYSKITINMHDSLIVCCTAGIKFNGSDDVFKYNGVKVSTSPRHIDYAFKDVTIFKLFEPHVSYIICDNESKKEHTLKADVLYYLKDENLVMKYGDDYYYYNYRTDKKSPFDKKLLSSITSNEQH